MNHAQRTIFSQPWRKELNEDSGGGGSAPLWPPVCQTYCLKSRLFSDERSSSPRFPSRGTVSIVLHKKPKFFHEIFHVLFLIIYS